MPTLEHYRKCAQDCRSLARDTHDTHEREVLLRMAAQWDRLAEYKGDKEKEPEQA
jgi:ribosomal protein S15P/S13E